jgi:putative hydrolase of the HAD superfamily
MVTDALKDIDLKGIKGILWDLDDTLYAYEPAHLMAFQSSAEMVYAQYAISNSDFEQHWKQARKTVHNDLHGQAASHSRLLYFQKMHEQMFGHTNAQFALEMEAFYWNTFMDNMAWKPGVQSFLEQAKKQGIRMCVVTDLTAQIQLQKWQKLDLSRYMDFLISSEEAGIEKPAAKMFELALQKLNLTAVDVIMIGDSMEKDIKGAEAFGIKTIWIQ